MIPIDQRGEGYPPVNQEVNSPFPTREAGANGKLQRKLWPWQLASNDSVFDFHVGSP